MSTCANAEGGVSYEFTLWARNGFGSSRPITTRFAVNQSVPTLAPGEVNVSAANETHALVEWTAIPSNASGARFSRLEYEVRYRRDRGQWRDSVARVEGGRSAYVGPLSKNKYNFQVLHQIRNSDSDLLLLFSVYLTPKQVRALNDAGFGPWSPESLGFLEFEGERMLYYMYSYLENIRYIIDTHVQVLQYNYK